jgi:DNA (cytosine-5)-methyltransferase 1
MGGTQSEMVGIDLFAGAGGMSLGAWGAGVNIALAVEADPRAADTYAHNHPNTTLFRRDIRQLRRSHLSEVARRGQSTVVFGGPPCQGFSYSNQRTRNADNPSNWLFLEFMRVVRLWQPDWVVFENVKGITNTEGGTFLNQVLEHLDSSGYLVAQAVLDAAAFGVAQHRERLFVVGSKEGVKLVLPDGTCSTMYTVADAIGDLPVLQNGASIASLPYGERAPSPYAKRLRGSRRHCANHLVSNNSSRVIARYGHIPEGGNWENIPPQLMRNYADRARCHTGIYHRLEAAKPSIVIGNFRKNMLIHPHANRGLSVREAARIQSFPDSYEFQGSIGFQQQQVGNAVPPRLAEAVFKSVLKSSGISLPRAELRGARI